jgi:hypothetical protein
MSQFANTGTVLFAPGVDFTRPRFVLICGMARGGTTAVAAGIEAAGISMGSNLSNVKEDLLLKKAIESSDIVKDFQKYLDERTSSSCKAPYPSVGGKSPIAYRRILELTSFDGLGIVLVVRDPLSAALREVSSMFQPLDKSIDFFIRMYREIFEIARKSKSIHDYKPRIVMISYEKVLSAPHKTFQSLFEKLGYDYTDAAEMASKSITMIDLEPSGYLQESNLKPEYTIDVLTCQKVSGWCFFSKLPSVHAAITVKYDNQTLGTILCDKPREDKDISCGFDIDMNDFDINITDKNKIALFLGDSEFQLLP